MKYFLITTAILIHLTATAQSPYLSILLKMDSVKTEFINYRISMKICEPLKMTERGDWLKHDTSSIDFSKLYTADINCGHYSYIEGTDDHAGSGTKFNIYEFGNQIFAWEKILVFQISNYSSRGWNPGMYIVIPIKYKSFLTSVNLTAVEFQSGKVIFLTNPEAVYSESYLNIRQSLKNEKEVKARSFPLEELLKDK